MKLRSLLSLLGILTLVSCVKPKPVVALEPSEISAKAKTFTVQIQGIETGSGTIIQHSGDTYTVLTCWHVLNTPGNYQISTVDGEQHQINQVKNLKEVDLAIVEFTSDNSYSVANLGNSEKLIEGVDTFVVGYPDPIPGIPERTYRFATASIISQLGRADDGYHLVHSNPLPPGSSGGAILDSDANLVGINGATTFDGNTNTAYGLGIPLELYLSSQDNFAVVSSDNAPNDLLSVGKRQIKQTDYQGAVETFDRAVESDRNSLEAYYGRGEAYYQLQDFNQAIQDFNQVLEINPQDAQAYLYRGYALAELGKYEEAIEDYNKSIDLNPDNANAYHHRGIAYQNTEKIDKALIDYTVAINLNPNNAQVYIDRANLYYNLADVEQEIADYTQAINIQPDSAKAFELRGEAYETKNQDQKAIKDFAAAASLYLQQQETAEFQRIFKAIAKKYETEDLSPPPQNYNQQLIDYTLAISQNPQDAQAYKNRGIVHKDLGESEKAIADLTRAISFAPEDFQTYNNRGIVYQNLAKYDDAIDDFTQAIELKSDFIEAYLNRAVIYQQLQRYSPASQDLQKAAELSKQQNELAQFYQILKIAQEIPSEYTQDVSQLQPEYFFANRG
jgi:tetratricopeptide (TPR) repeat protein